MELNEKICIQCCRQLPITQFKTYKTKGGLKYRNYCHQCTYNNNRFNILSKELSKRQLTEDEYTAYEMTMQLFDAYSDAGGTIGSGAYNELRGKSKRELTLEQQLADAQQRLAPNRDVMVYTEASHYVADLDVANIDNELLVLLQQSMEDWSKRMFKPSFLRAINADLKKRLWRDNVDAKEADIKGLQKLSTKIWDYEEYLADTFKADMPEWLQGEELIV